ncbi:hypothetical protein HDU86_007698 [Geranomyces michiganensis]|nr:hypothetical protein HDU86_007698 [Geranomyces michiganensis]
MSGTSPKLPEFLEECLPHATIKRPDLDVKTRQLLISKRVIKLMGLSVRHRAASYTAAELLKFTWMLSVVSLDHDLQRIAADVVGDALAIVADQLGALPDWLAKRKALCTSLAAFTGEDGVHRIWMLRDLLWGCSKSVALTEARRYLAKQFVQSLSADAVSVNGNNQVDVDESEKMLKPIMDALDKAPMFAVAHYGRPRSPEDYLALGNSVRVLAVAIGPAEAARKEPDAAKQIASRLRHIFGNIADPRGAYPERTEAKHELISLSTWLRFVTAHLAEPGAQSRLTFVKSEVKTEPEKPETITNSNSASVKELVETLPTAAPAEAESRREGKAEDAKIKAENI